MKAGDYSSAAYGVNRAGQVVGYTQNQSLPDSAFIYNALNDITTDLNTITLNGGQTAASLNWNLTSAVSINDAGVIVSQGQIISGTYTECCGIGGGLTHPLPDASQGFVELIIDPQRNLAQMTFSGQEMHTILSIPADGPRSGITFLFRDGEVLSDHIHFGGPIPVPEQDQPSFSYAVSNATDTLRINGGVVTPCPGCADFFTRFEHTNLVAVLKSTPVMPRLSLTALSTDGVFGFIIRDGRWGQTNVVEASADLIAWTPVSTNVFPPTACPECPFIEFRDPASTNLTRRFYRSFTLP